MICYIQRKNKRDYRWRIDKCMHDEYIKRMINIIYYIHMYVNVYTVLGKG